MTKAAWLRPTTHGNSVATNSGGRIQEEVLGHAAACPVKAASGCRRAIIRVADVTLAPQGQAQFRNLADGDVGVARLSYDDA